MMPPKGKATKGRGRGRRPRGLGEGTLILSYISMPAGAILGVQILNFNILGVSERRIFFLGG